MRIILALLMVMVFMGLTTYAQNNSFPEEANGFMDSILPATYVEPEFSLCDEDDEFEQRLTDGWKKFSSEINVRDLSIHVSQLAQEYKRIAFKPHIALNYFYVEGAFRYSYNSRTGMVANIYPQYTDTNRGRISKTISDIKKETQKFMLYIKKDMSDFEKVMTVHDHMVLSYRYDEDSHNNNITIMTTKTGMCVSYAVTFNHFMNELGIQSAYVSSEIMNHAWNLVKIDGKWYHIDVTWDDPIHDHFSHVHHEFALLSTNKIQRMSEPHFGFDLGNISADSTLYDNASWRDGTASVVAIGGKEYWVTKNNLVCSDGRVIYENLDGGDGYWNISEYRGYSDVVWSGISVYDNKLYFNTDRAIMVYDVYSGKTETLKTEFGISGMYIDNGVLKYSKYDGNKGWFEYSDEIKLGEIEVKTEIDENGDITVDFYKENDDVVKIFAFGNDGCQVKEINDNGLVSAKFNAGEEVVLFFWDENLRPLKPKMQIYP